MGSSGVRNAGRYCFPQLFDMLALFAGPLSAHKKTECRSTLLCLSSVGHDRQPEFVSGSLIDFLLLKQLLVEVLKPDHFCRPFFRSLCTLHENSPFWAF